jgi:hypothetical protein
MENQNRIALDKLENEFKQWLHIEDSHYLHTLLAVKISHKIDGDPIWLMIIGPSSDGKSEYLRAITQEEEIVVDDVTEKTFVSGMKESLRTQDHLAKRLKGKQWYMYDLSIMLSKRAEERSSILSDMRMIYDGRIVKEFGNGDRIDIDTSGNTLICASTPEIDSTMLEDQLLGTRFITYRINTKNRFAVMDVIDRNEDKTDFMREKLKFSVREFEHSFKLDTYTMTDLENQNLQLTANTTTLLRASVGLDKTGEPRNLVYPEGPGRLYKQIKKLYKCYRIIGLSEDESLRCIRKVCRDNINPVRIKLLEYLNNNKNRNNYVDGSITTSKIHVHTGLGKKTIKSHLHCMNMMGLVGFTIKEENYREVDYWDLRDSNLNLILEMPSVCRCGVTLWKYANSKKVVTKSN